MLFQRDKEDDVILDLVNSSVLEVRSILLHSHPENPTFVGLCDQGTALLEKYLPKIISNEYDPNIKVKIEIIHGELAHNPRTKSDCWFNEHTWASIRIGSKKIYVDATCGQFKPIIPDIPDYYISTVRPKWFYPDKRNPAWNGITKAMNKKIRIYTTLYGEIWKFGIIEWLQFRVWGTMSDRIHERFYCN